MPGGLFNRLKSWVRSQPLHARDLNGEFDNLIAHISPEYIQGFQGSLPQFQAQISPGLPGSESMQGTLAGEIQTLRYMISLCNGYSASSTSPYSQSYNQALWYVPSSLNLANMSATGRNMLVNPGFLVSQFLAAGSSVSVQNPNFSLVTGTSVSASYPNACYLVDGWYLNNTMDGGATVTGYNYGTSTPTQSLTGVSLLVSNSALTTSGGPEIYQTLPADDSSLFFDNYASFSATVWGLGTVRQVGIQFYQSTNNGGKVSIPIGSEQMFSVNASTGTLCQISGQYIPNLNATSEIPNGYSIGIRIRPTAVLGETGGSSTPAVWNAGNGFFVAEAVMNIGAVPLNFFSTLEPYSHVFARCQRFYETSYPYGTLPGSTSSVGTYLPGDNSNVHKHYSIFFKSPKYLASNINVVFYDSAGSAGAFSCIAGDGTLSNSQTGGTVASTSENCFEWFPATIGTSENTFLLHWVADARI